MRLLLGHRIDCNHTDYFPEALTIADRFGVRSDPAFVLLDPDGHVLWKHVGKIDAPALLTGLSRLRSGVPAGSAVQPLGH